MYRVTETDNLSTDWILVHLYHYCGKNVTYGQKL